MELKICHLYNDVLNIYGDRGNIICLERRLKWRDIECSIERVGIGEPLSLDGVDIVFIGGGQDFEQEVLLSDLKSGKDKEILSAIEDGRTFLCICGGYQMLGNYYQTYRGEKIEYLGAVDLYTVGMEKRMIGNYIYRLNDIDYSVVGFENHSGKTFLGKGVKPLGKVKKGFGNNGEDGTEGVRYKNVFGTYSHGPVLPKNPGFCDYIIKTALERKYGDCKLEPLSDRFEKLAHNQAVKIV